MSKPILLLNGPNLNLLGQREPDVYGSMTLMDIENAVQVHANAQGVDVQAIQSNVEGELIDALHQAQLECIGVVFNPGGYSHTSVAIRDAIAAIKVPVVEVHLSNIHAREDFRKKSITAEAAVACISGMGLHGYLSGVDLIIRDHPTP